MDKEWTIAIVSAGISGVLSVVIALWARDRRKKCLAWEVVSSSALVTKTTENDGIEILYQGVKVEAPHVSTLRVLNTGNVPVTKDDYDKPLTFGLESDCLGTTIVWKTDGFDPSVRQLDSQQFSLEPVLFNPGDSLKLQVITRSKPNVQCAGRIVGGNVRALAMGASGFSRSISIVAVLPSLAIIIYILWYSGRQFYEGIAKGVRSGKWEDVTIPVIGTFAVLTILGFFGFLRWLGEKYGNRSNWPDRWR